MHIRPAIPAGLAGNSRLLASYSGQGELQALYWPHIDREQHVHQFFCGLVSPQGATEWLHQSPWTHTQRYEPDTAVLSTVATHPGTGLVVETADFAIAGQDALVRQVRVTNPGSQVQPARLVVYAHLRLEESAQYNTVMQAPEINGLFFYRRHTWMALGATSAPAGWQCGRPGRPSDAWVEAGRAALSGRPIDCGDVNAALLYDLGVLAPGESCAVTLYLAPGNSRDEVTAAMARLLASPAADWLAETSAWWQAWLASGRQVSTGSERLDFLYRRSLIALKLMSDERGGGFIAGPECDPDYKLSGGYAYCWGRDAAYMTTALDEAGHHAETAAFFLRWAARAQEASGAWLHRHYVDGTLAPSWGLLQIDEGASILFGAWRHYELSGDKAFVQAFWPAIARGADYLVSYRDPATGLPAHSIDLWEKRDALHSYSSAAVHAGLTGAARLAEVVGEDGSRYARAAGEIREAMERHLWSEEQGRFLRTIGLVNTGPAEAGRRDLAVADLPDTALLGVEFPFGTFGPQDPRVRSTVARLEEALTVPGTGAVYRYEGDQYIGGHPWLICSLWLAIDQLAVGNRERAEQLIAWTADRATPLGFLPEQVDLATGQPTWVTPLAWSHAMFVLALHRLAGVPV